MNKKRIVTSALLISLAVASVGILSSSESDVSALSYYRNYDPKNPSSIPNSLPEPRIFPDSPSSQQSYSIWGKTTRESHPGVYLSQNDEGLWKVDTYRSENQDFLENIDGEDGKKYPAIRQIFNKIDLTDPVYSPNDLFVLSDGNTKKPIAEMIDKKIMFISDMDSPPYNGTGYKMILHEQGFQEPFFWFRILIGGDPAKKGYSPIEGSNEVPYAFAHNDLNKPKYQIGYKLGFMLEWWGEYKTTKKLEIKGSTGMSVGQSQSLKAIVETMEPGTKYFGTEVDVTSRDQTAFRIKSGDSVTLSGQGNVTAVKAGTTVIEATWNSPVVGSNNFTWQLVRTISITVGSGGGGSPPGGGGCTVPVRTQTLKPAASFMQPNVTGVLLADQRGSSQYDVSLGIPVLETLYANILAKTYLLDYEYGKYEGTCEWKVKVSQTSNLSWSESENVGTYPTYPLPGGGTGGGGPKYECVDKTDSVLTEVTYTVKRKYSYWATESFESYKIKEAVVNNYALPGDSVKLDPQNYSSPTIHLVREGDWTNHISEPEVVDKVLANATLSGSCGVKPTVNGSPEWTDVAEAQVEQVKVRNDTVLFNSVVIMNAVWYNESTPSPGTIPEGTQISGNTLYRSSLVVPPEKSNSSANPTSGNLTYTDLTSLTPAGDKSFPIAGLAPVTIHTPVVNYSVIPDVSKAFDQSLVPDRAKLTFVLGRDVVVEFGESGQHRSIQGYGNRDYSKYTREKRIQFPFDVYSSGTFYPANSWIAMGVGTSSLTVRVPEWVTEGSYQVRTESWAVNAPSTSSGIAQHNANASIGNYGAYETFVARVVGRVYGFRLYDIGDLRYEKVFRKYLGSDEWSGFQYYSGSAGKDGEALTDSVTSNLTLPVRPGSHPTQAATTPHNGYPILFYFNTVGNVWNVGEGVRITPTFHFVPKKGGVDSVPVDLYYNTSSKKMVRVGSDLDKSLFTRTIVMGDPLRNVSNEYLTAMGQYEYDRFWTAEAKSKTPLAKFLLSLSSRKTTIGKGYGELVLNYQTRTLVGKVDTSISVSESDQKRAVQRWFGEYNLPIAPYILPKGTNIEQLARTKYGGLLTGKEREFLSGGYIVVKFNIETYTGSDSTKGVLGYDASSASNANMWKIEKQVTSSSTYLGSKFDFNYGDIIMFESDFSVRNDFKGSGS